MLNSIIDISHYQTNVNFSLLKAGGIVAVIHKCTQGLNYHDVAYNFRKQQAIEAGLLWGSYHFGDNSDPVKQADYYLDCAGKEGMHCLDLEWNRSQMNLSQAKAFIERVESKTGVFPTLYTNTAFLNQYLKGQKDAFFARCPLWVAQYNVSSPNIQASWKDWTLWQYTGNGMVQGVAGNVDRSYFNGTLDQLKQLFNNV